MITPIFQLLLRCRMVRLPTELPNGDYITDKPDGTVVSYTSSDGTTITTKPDGTKTTENKDGTMITTKPDGTKITEKNDGSWVVHSKKI